MRFEEKRKLSIYDMLIINTPFEFSPIIVIQYNVKFVNVIIKTDD